MNWQVRNPLHCTAAGCTAKAEIEALRAQVAEDEANLLHASGVIIELREQLAAMTKEAKTLATANYENQCELQEQLATAQARIKELREHLALAVLYGPPMAIGNVLSKDALATPNDSSALDRRLQEEYLRGFSDGAANYATQAIRSIK